ncbi:hypothetical protein C5167_027473 [Papaver somniferum]|nr:hypothetical protein C5167_027473 [Papaver somniferum]
MDSHQSLAYSTIIEKFPRLAIFVSKSQTLILLRVLRTVNLSRGSRITRAQLYASSSTYGPSDEAIDTSVKDIFAQATVNVLLRNYCVGKGTTVFTSENIDASIESTATFSLEDATTSSKHVTAISTMSIVIPTHHHSMVTASSLDTTYVDQGAFGRVDSETMLLLDIINVARSSISDLS